MCGGVGSVEALPLKNFSIPALLVGGRDSLPVPSGVCGLSGSGYGVSCVLSPAKVFKS